MRLLIVRHGETDGNLMRICQLPDAVLTERGRRQAEALATHLEGEKIDAIFCSSYKRAKQTLDCIVKKVRAPVFIEPLIREREAGMWEGKSVDDFIAYMESKGLKPHEFKPDGGESLSDVLERAKWFWRKIKGSYSGKAVLLVAHGDFNKVFIGSLLGKPLEGMLKMGQDNCCLNELIVKGGKAEALRINYTDFLGDLASPPTNSAG